jgi:hypothetical protein
MRLLLSKINSLIKNIELIFKNTIGKLAVKILSKSEKSSLVNLIKLQIHLIETKKETTLDIGWNSVSGPIVTTNSNIQEDIFDLAKLVSQLKDTNKKLSSSLLTEEHRSVIVRDYFSSNKKTNIDLKLSLEKLINYTQQILSEYEKIERSEDKEGSYRYNELKIILNKLLPLLQSISSLK